MISGSSNSLNSSNDGIITTSDNIPDSEGGKYNITEIIKVHLPTDKTLDVRIEYLDSTSSQNASFTWAIDSMLIDEELLYAEDAEAD
jgi:hypothetical protein